jgi:glyoxylase I family protein
VVLDDGHGLRDRHRDARRDGLHPPQIRHRRRFRDHAGTIRGSFDETRVGMDHIALAVSSTADLDEWTAWLDQHQVEHSEVEASHLGHHLNLRAPDRIAVELFVLRDEAAALGLG